MTFGSLFTGIGGMDLGLEQAGMRCVWQVEIDPFCRRVLAKHWPNVPRWDDVTTFTGEGVATPDCIVGGDPCQANSAAGKSSAVSLGAEFLRVVAAIRPRIVLRENPTHVRKNAPWPWWRFRDGLRSLGYVVLPFRLRACCVGADHRRDRLFLLATFADANSNRLERGPRSQGRVESVQLPRLVASTDWPQIPTDFGFDSRAGIPGYVDGVRGLGNAVVPQVAQWIGKQIMKHGRVS